MSNQQIAFDVWCLRWLIDLSVFDLTFLFSLLPALSWPGSLMLIVSLLSCIWLPYDCAHCPAPTDSQHELSLPPFPGAGAAGVQAGEMRRSRWSLYSWNVWIIAGCVSPFSHITCDRLIVAKLSSHTHDLSVCQDQIDKIKASRNSRYNSTITQHNIVHRLSRFY